MNSVGCSRPLRDATGRHHDQEFAVSKIYEIIEEAAFGLQEARLKAADIVYCFVLLRRFEQWEGVSISLL